MGKTIVFGFLLASTLAAGCDAAGGDQDEIELGLAAADGRRVYQLQLARGGSGATLRYTCAAAECVVNMLVRSPERDELRATVPPRPAEVYAWDSVIDVFDTVVPHDTARLDAPIGWGMESGHRDVWTGMVSLWMLRGIHRIPITRTATLDAARAADVGLQVAFYEADEIVRELADCPECRD